MTDQKEQGNKAKEETTTSEASSKPEVKLEQLRKQEEQAKKNQEDPTTLMTGSQNQEVVEELTEQEERDKKTLKELITLAWRRLIHETCEILEQLIKYAIQAFAGLVLFGLFFFASLGVYRLCDTWPEISIMVMIKAVAWFISILGAICCIALVVRNTIVFIKYLIKGPPQGTYRS